MTIAQQIKAYHKALQLPLGAEYKARTLCNAHNWATCPSRPMTDREHHACRRLSHRVFKTITNCLYETYCYESDSGLFVMYN